MKVWLWLIGVAVFAADAPRLPVPLFSQEKNGCGAAAVAMVAHYWRGAAPNGLDSPQAIYQQLYERERGGVPLSRMKEYFERLGLSAFTLYGEWKDLVEQIQKGRPVIVGLKKNPRSELHFVVAVGADDEAVWLHDPARKKAHRVKRERFEKQWRHADAWLLLAAPSRLAN